MLKRVLLACCLSFCFAGGPAAALEVDFDYHLFVAEDFFGEDITLRGVDGDGNGLLEEDQLGMLSAILKGGSALEACVNADAVSAIQATYPENLSQVDTDLTATVNMGFPYGTQTIHVIDELNSSDPDLAGAIQNLAAGFMTFADASTVSYVNTIVDLAIDKGMTGLLTASQIAEVQAQINLSASNYHTYGNAGNEPNYLGAAGDIDGDGFSNLDEYVAVSGNREAWITACCMHPSLRFTELQGGGIKLTGGAHTFSAATTAAEGPVSFEWRKGTTSSYTVVASADRYTIGFLNTADSGDYYCVASDGVTTKATPARSLTVVYVALFISQNILGGTRSVGGSHTFTVAAQGGQPGPYAYVWRHDGLAVGSNSPTLTLTSLQLSDAGQYTVTVSSNGGGDAKSSGPVTLTVNPAPLSITQQPQGATRTEGESYTFQVAAEGGSGNYHYDWRKDGLSLGAPDLGSYTITPVAAGDAGFYSCVVSDSEYPALTVTSAEAQLIVLGMSLAITTQPRGAVKKYGEAYTFLVSVAGGSGSYHYQWRKNASPLAAPDDHACTIDPITLADAGVYSCYIEDASNPAWNTLSQGASLLVLTDPVNVVTQPQSATVYEGQRHVFFVEVSGGTGSWHYDWRKEGVSLGAADSATLTLNSVLVSDAGAYSCLVRDANQPSNQALSATAALTVLSVAPLAVVTQPQGAKRYVGQAHTFSLTVMGGSGAYHFDWRKEGMPLGAEDASSLTLPSLLPEEAGSYTCVVTDTVLTEQSVSSAAALLEVAEHLQITRGPEGVERFAGQPLAISVEVSGGFAPLSYDWRLDDSSIGEAPGAPLLDLGLAHLVDMGVYLCRVSDGIEVVDSAAATISVTACPIPEHGVRFEASLDGAGALPPNASAAVGLATGYLLPVEHGGTLVLDLLHDVVNAALLTLNEGLAGSAGPVMIDFGLPAWSDSEEVLLTAEQASFLLLGSSYLQIASAAYPSGEIRAQVLVETPDTAHSADTNGDFSISLSELLRVIQFFNLGGLHCQADTEDGYAPGSGLQGCLPHDSDYSPQDWQISLSELLRLIQFFNSTGHAYHTCGTGEDGFCPGPG